MRKVAIFGRSVSLLAVLLVCFLAAGASAALVGYLSNTVSAGGEVQSPFELQIRNHVDTNETPGADSDYWADGWTDSITFDTLYGGETLIIDYKLENRANTAIHGDVQMEVLCNNGISAETPDFVDVLLRRSEYPESPISFDVAQGANAYRALYTTNSEYTYNNAEETTYGTVEFFTVENAVGTYTITGKMIPSNATHNFEP